MIPNKLAPAAAVQIRAPLSADVLVAAVPG